MSQAPEFDDGETIELCTFCWPDTKIPCASRAKWVVVSGTNGGRSLQSCCDGHLVWTLHNAMARYGAAHVTYALGARPPEPPST